MILEADSIRGQVQIGCFLFNASFAKAAGKSYDRVKKLTDGLCTS